MPVMKLSSAVAMFVAACGLLVGCTGRVDVSAKTRQHRGSVELYPMQSHEMTETLTVTAKPSQIVVTTRAGK